MSVTVEEIRGLIREELNALLPPDLAADQRGDDVSLISGGLLDSVAALKLVDRLEEVYEIEFEPEELSAEFLDTVTQMAELVRTKIGER